MQINTCFDPLPLNDYSELSGGANSQIRCYYAITKEKNITRGWDVSTSQTSNSEKQIRRHNGHFSFISVCFLYEIDEYEVLS